MNHFFKKKILIIFIIICFIFLLFFLNKKKNYNYWEENNCSRGVPEEIIDINKVNDYIFKIDNKKGFGLEEFKIYDNQYSIGHTGCSNFDLKFLIQSMGSENIDLRDHIIGEFNMLKIVSKSEYIFNDLIQNFENLESIIYNLRNYSCNNDFCSFYTVVLEPLEFNGKEYILVKINYIL